MIKTQIISLVLALCGLSHLSAIEVSPVAGSGVSGQYNTSADPGSGDNSLGHQTRALPASEIFVGGAGGGGSAYLIAFETTKEIRDAANAGSVTLVLPLTDVTGPSVSANVALLGGSEKTSVNKWGNFGAYNVAVGMTQLGTIEEDPDIKSYTFDVDWEGKGVWAEAPFVWFVIYTPRALVSGEDKLVFSGDPKLVIN